LSLVLATNRRHRTARVPTLACPWRN
jgi:hypothetical protein